MASFRHFLFAEVGENPVQIGMKGAGEIEAKSATAIIYK